MGRWESPDSKERGRCTRGEHNRQNDSGEDHQPLASRSGGDFLSGCVVTIDGARDNWFGPWPPPGATGESGEPLAEERRKRDG